MAVGRDTRRLTVSLPAVLAAGVEQLALDAGTNREVYGPRLQTLAEAWADIRRRAGQDHAARWRVYTCPAAGCRFSQWG